MTEETIKRDLGQVLRSAEELQEESIRRTLEPKAEGRRSSAKTRRRRPSTFLQDPNLLDRILEDFERCGLVGEETNKLTAYLAAVSRKLDEPLAVIVQSSSSAAGKSALMEAVLAFVPEEEREKYSAMTGQVALLHGREQTSSTRSWPSSRRRAPSGPPTP